MPARTTPVTVPTPWMTKREAAVYLRISVETLDRWQERGVVVYHKVGALQSVRLKREELDALHQRVERERES
jgi:excisionase family DNA binding protein